jgi:hypothetical protein
MMLRKQYLIKYNTVLVLILLAICRNLVSFRGASPPDPLTRGVAPGPHLGFSPQTIYKGSRYRARHWPDLTRMSRDPTTYRTPREDLPCTFKGVHGIQIIQGELIHFVNSNRGMFFG